MSIAAGPPRPTTVTGRALAAWLVLGLVTAALIGPLRHSAPGPGSLDPGGLRLLIDQLGPSAPLLWLVRLIATAAAAAHLALLTLGIIARTLGAIGTVRLLDRLSPAAIRRLLTPITVMSLTGTMTITGTMSLSAMASPSAATPTPPPPAVMVVAAPIAAVASTTSLTPATIEVDSTVTMPAPSSAAIASAPVASSAASPATEPASTPLIGATVIVARGDSLWSIAEHALHTQLGRSPTERETSRYWRALIEANRDRLVDRSNPSRIFAGQQFTLP